EELGEPLVIVRARDGVLRAFYNVCQHRGTAVVEEQCGKAVRFQCPYHAWIYDLDGKLIRAKHTEDLDDFSFDTFGLRPVRLAVWQGFVFVSLDPDGPELTDFLADLVPHWNRFDFGALRSAKQVRYEVGSNWKFIGENYSECYHCPGLHPQLNKLTPYDLGGDYESEGPWEGGWMELAGDAETMALEGGHRNGRPAIPGMTQIDERRVYYYLLWPNTFISIHPDYVLVHRLVPLSVDKTIVICDWLFEPSTMAMPGFDATDAYDFWDLTNRQDWHVCELQHRGTSSRSWVAGRFSNQEASVHAFDLMIADRYANDGVEVRRTVRERYDTPPPKTELSGGIASAAKTEARLKARAAAK
ncbi:MAG: aromatic ring-hydroxylating dioxygenase subunit alpha, partial [Candidatus Limnocylindrales bacterium]